MSHPLDLTADELPNDGFDVLYIGNISIGAPRPGNIIGPFRLILLASGVQ
jgi:hypothetical protein